MSLDPEIQAMSDITSAIEGLDDETRARVLNWAHQRFGVSASSQGEKSAGESMLGNDKTVQSSDNFEYEEFHDLFEAAGPESRLDRVLTACYWFQVIEKESNLDSYSINKELKHLGYGSSNITRDMNTLMGHSPSLVMKVRKEGSSKQARNLYKLTKAGIQTVEEMLART